MRDKFHEIVREIVINQRNDENRGNRHKLNYQFLFTQLKNYIY